LGSKTISLGYSARDDFRPYHNRTNRYAAIVAHRRAGKTVACVMDLLVRALQCEKPNPRFAYIAPHYNQAKDIAWDYVKQYAAPVLEFGGAINEAELRVDLPNGGRVRLYGGDNYNRLRGLFFDGVVLDEYADMDPRVWEVVRPCLSDREGWCSWIGTPKGMNAFYNVFEQAKREEDWYALELRASKTGILPTHELDAAKKDLSVDQYAQEYECSFQAAVQGAYYGTEMQEAHDDKRITKVPHDKSLETFTAWDLGIGDATSIWFIQVHGFEVRVIDFYEASGVGLDHYVKVIKEKPYIYGQHILPHDVEVKELGTGKSRKEVLRSLGLSVDVAPKLSIEDGIQAVRALLSRCFFDEEKCRHGVEALKQYRKEFDEKNKVFRVRPLHDWTSHAADAFRYFAVGHKKQAKIKDIELNLDWIA
jgi:phage terminase large subunit